MTIKESEIMLEYRMLQVDIQLASFNSYMYEDGDNESGLKSKIAALKKRITMMIESFKGFLHNLFSKVREKLLTKSYEKEVENAKKVAPVLEKLDMMPEIEADDHTQEYKAIEYTRFQLKNIVRRLETGKPVKEDEITALMEDYRQKRIKYAKGHKKRDSYGWGVSGTIGNINGMAQNAISSSYAIGFGKAWANGNLALAAINLPAAVETLRAGILLDKEEAELKVKDLTEQVKFVKKLNELGQRVTPEMMEDLVKSPRNKLDRFFTG